MTGGRTPPCVGPAGGATDPCAGTGGGTRPGVAALRGAGPNVERPGTAAGAAGAGREPDVGPDVGRGAAHTGVPPEVG
ncbi:hypothetical protein CELD12_22350 [Cellulomonas sp. NTE-D12]|nr:hypothetical protein CELD12_22350 [Cellulomonas sp. NTE-D12]